MAESRPVPLVHDETRPFWDATKEGRLVLQRCEDCGRAQHYPRSICTSCHGTRLRFDPASGRGTIYSFTIVHRAPHPAFTPPYVIALVRLEEGPVMLSRIVDCAFDAIRCDMPVAVSWDPLPEGYQLPVFRPA